MKKLISISFLTLLICVFLCNCSKNNASLKNHMTETEKESISVNPLSLLDNTYEYPWEFDRAATEEIKDYVSEISIYGSL